VRRISRRFNRFICLLFLAGGLVGSMLATGCGGSTPSTATQNVQVPQFYTLTVTASGGGLEHTSTFTLAVK
jgi:hypothetical protein